MTVTCLNRQTTLQGDGDAAGKNKVRGKKVSSKYNEEISSDSETEGLVSGFAFTFKFLFSPSFTFFSFLLFYFYSFYYRTSVATLVIIVLGFAVRKSPGKDSPKRSVTMERRRKRRSFDWLNATWSS